MLKKILESTIIMGTSSVLVLALNLVRVKILAVLLGPSGVGVLSVLNNLHVVAATFIGLGLGTGIIKYVSSFNSKKNEVGVQKVLTNSFQITLLLSLVVMVPAILISSHLSNWILSDPKYSLFIIIYAISLPLAVYPTATNSFLQGLKRIKALAKINFLRSSISLLFIIPLVYFFRIKGAVISVLVITGIHLLLNKYYLKKEKARHIVLRWRPFDSDLMKKLFQYGLTSLLVGSAYYLSHLLLKITIVNSLGLEVNGIYQPIWALTMTYLTLVLSSMSAYSYPRLCELTSIRDITEELNGILRVAVLLITPVMFFLLVARKPIIQILYSSSFLDATKYMPIQILGDFFKVLFWSVGMFLLPTKRLFAFIWLNLLQDITLVVLAVLLVDRYQLYGITAAFTLSYLIAFLALFLYSKKQITLNLWPRNQILLWSSFGALVAIYLCDRFLSTALYIVAAALVLGGWILLSVKKDEYLQLKEYIAEKLFKNLPSIGSSSP
ncbi:MAG: O-antigen translocase [Candidatus Aminicenantaceae bacterium]